MYFGQDPAVPLTLDQLDDVELHVQPLAQLNRGLQPLVHPPVPLPALAAPAELEESKEDEPSGVADDLHILLILVPMADQVDFVLEWRLGSLSPISTILMVNLLSQMHVQCESLLR